jgi:anti-sigma-K factor RskA
MVKYENPQLRDKLAAEYALGTLRGRARMRFRRLLKYDVELRRNVCTWEERLAPLDELALVVTPPARVWQKIAARIGDTSTNGGWRGSLAVWRTLAAASTMAVLALGIYLGTVPAPEPPIATVAVMFDEQSRPAMVVSWPPREAGDDYYIRVKLLQERPATPANTSWELWMLPRAKAAPISLGLVGLDHTQVVKLKPEVARMLGQAWGVALSVEPKGGSPTGSPTGPVIFQGQCVEVM